MKRSIVFLQLNSIDDFYENISTLEGFIDLLSNKKPDLFIIPKDSLATKLNGQQKEELFDCISALSDFNEAAIVTAFTDGTSSKTIIQMPYKDPIIISKQSKLISLCDTLKVNIIANSKELEASYKKDFLNIVCDCPTENTNDTQNKTFYQSLCYSVHPSCGGSLIYCAGKTLKGGNCEGYIILEV